MNKTITLSITIGWIGLTLALFITNKDPNIFLVITWIVNTILLFLILPPRRGPGAEDTFDHNTKWN